MNYGYHNAKNPIVEQFIILVVCETEELKNHTLIYLSILDHDISHVINISTCLIGI